MLSGSELILDDKTTVERYVISILTEPDPANPNDNDLLEAVITMQCDAEQDELQVVGPDGLSYMVDRGRSIRIGRETTNDMVISGAMVSRDHLEITFSVNGEVNVRVVGRYGARLECPRQQTEAEVQVEVAGMVDDARAAIEDALDPEDTTEPAGGIMPSRHDYPATPHPMHNETPVELIKSTAERSKILEAALIDLTRANRIREDHLALLKDFPTWFKEFGDAFRRGGREAVEYTERRGGWKRCAAHIENMDALLYSSGCKEAHLDGLGSELEQKLAIANNSLRDIVQRLRVNRDKIFELWEMGTNQNMVVQNPDEMSRIAKEIVELCIGIESLNADVKSIIESIKSEQNISDTLK
jgi:hypothetical protein